MSARPRGALLLFLALSWAALEVAGQGETFKGYATAYTWPGEKNSQFAGGFNACQFGRLSPYFETYFAALNVAQYEQGLCGRCAAVRGTGARATGKVVVVMIVDACATCAFGDLDFTTRGSNDITGYSFDHQPIEWWWTSCSDPVPPRWPYFDVAGGMEIVSKARAQGYNVNLAMMQADLTLTGGVIPYPPPPPPLPPPPPQPSPPQPSPPPDLDLQPRGLVLAPPMDAQAQLASLPGMQQALPVVPPVPEQPQLPESGQEVADQQKA